MPAKKGCFLSLQREKQISPLFAPYKTNILENYPSGPPGKNPSETHG